MEDMEALASAVRGKRILLFGPPGCGKGNRSRDLEELGLVHVASGIALREKTRRDPDSELSRRARDLMERGELVTDDIIVPIIMEHVGRPECRERGFVLDGFPRSSGSVDSVGSSTGRSRWQGGCGTRHHRKETDERASGPTGCRASFRQHP